MPSGSGYFLPFFYDFSPDAIDELDARCGSGCPGPCPGCGRQTFATNFGGLDDKTELYWPFFYNRDVIQRASTIVHEARHADVKGHNGGTTCGMAARAIRPGHTTAPIDTRYFTCGG